MSRFLVLVLVVLSVAGCEPRGQIVLDPGAASVGTVERLFIGTTRGPDRKTGKPLGNGRSGETKYLQLDVSVPPDRAPGQISWPRQGRPAERAKQFLATEEKAYASAAEFRAALGTALHQNPNTSREVVVFVHGFNNNFAEGAYRLAQLSHDLGVTATLVHYSWPSLAHPLGYAYDRDSALFARDGLEDLLREVEAAGARNILIVAHSMGAAITMETLRQIAIARDSRLASKISGIVLISPDVDVDVFRAQAARISPLPEPFVIFTSKRDRALALSARLSGQKERLGNIKDISPLADLKVTFLDTSAYSTGAGHFNIGNSPALLSIMGRLPELNSAFAGDPTSRAGLLPGAILTVRSATEIILSPVSALSGSLN